jgi:hypothetical protein
MLLFLVVLVVSVMLLNKGRPWIINALAIDEPFLIALGVLIAFLPMHTGFNPPGSTEMWVAVGALVSLFGLYAVWSDRVDVSGLIG